MTLRNNENGKLFTGTFLLANLLNLLVLTGYNLINILYPLRLEDFGKHTSKIGLIMGAFAVAGLSARLLSGPWIDRIGRLFFIRFGIIIAVTSALLYAIPVKSDIYIIMVRIIHGVSHGFFFTSMFTWIADYSPRSRLAESLGLFGISGLITISIGPYIGENILRTTNYNYLYFFIAAVAFYLFGLFLSLFLKELHHVEEGKPTGSLLFLMANVHVAAVAVIAFIFGMGTSSIWTFMAPYVRLKGLGKVSTFFTAYTAAAIAVRLFFGSFADGIKRQYVISGGFIIMMLGLSYIYKAGTPGELLIIGIFIGTAHGFVYPSMNALIIERAGFENKGAGTGLFNASVDSGNLAGAFIFGLAAERLSFPAMYALAGIIISSGVLIFYIGELIRRCTDSLNSCRK